MSSSDYPAFQAALFTFKSHVFFPRSAKHSCLSSRPIPSSFKKSIAFRLLPIALLNNDHTNRPHANLHVSPDQTRMPPSPSSAVDVSLLKTELLNLLPSIINDAAQMNEVKRLILLLEANSVLPVTEIFTEIALSGSWKLLFSSTRIQPKGNVRISQITQHFDMTEKKITNRALWSFPDPNDVEHIPAVLNVVSSYSFKSPHCLEVAVKEHKVEILSHESKLDLPQHFPSLIKELQATLPPEFFDPSGLQDVSYLEPKFRLARFVDNPLSGVRNVFKRTESTADLTK